MTTEALHRKARFRAALTMAGKTMRGFAADQGVTPEHLSYVIAGKRESARLLGEVESFIETYTPRPVAA